MRRILLSNIGILTGLWLLLLAGLGAMPDHPSAAAQRYAPTGVWTLYQDPSGQGSVPIRGLRAI